MGLLDKAKKLAGQAKDLAQSTIEQQRSGPADSHDPHDPRFGTPYAPGMLGRSGWREQDLVDPAGVLPIVDRDRAGIPRSTKSVILEQPFGMGRRWTAGAKSAGLYYRLHPDHQAWQPPSPGSPLTGVAGAVVARLDDGRVLVMFGSSVVLEASGLDDGTLADLARAVHAQVGG